MSCHVCGGLRAREGYNPTAKVILECQETEACVRAAPSYFTEEQRTAAGVPKARLAICTSSECAIRDRCTGSAACPRALGTPEDIERATAAYVAKGIRDGVFVPTMGAEDAARLASFCERNGLLDADRLAAKRKAVAPTIAKIQRLRPVPPAARTATESGAAELERSLGHQPPSYAAFMDGDARERDVYGQPVDDGRVGTWVQTASGHKLWPLDPRPGDIWLIDVARGLANECRYGRQMKRRGLWYSVAEHCVLVSRFVAQRYPDHPEWAREALLHDGDEAYGFGDIPRPLKHDPRIKPLVTPIEERWQAAIFERFGVVSTPESRAAIKEIDNLIILDEIPALMRAPELYSIRHPERVERLNAPIRCWSPPLAEVAFLVEFGALFPEHAAEARRLSASPEAA